MAAEERVVELIVDASGVEAGMRRAEAAYDHMGDRAEAATAKAQAAFDRQIQVYTGRLPKSIDGVGDAYDRLQARMDPVFHAQLRAEREMTQSIAVINRAVLLGVTTEQQATRDIIRLKQQQIEAIQRVRDAQQAANSTPVMTPANDNQAAHRRGNLGYQLFDIGQTAALGMSPAMILMQQGPQIAQLYAGQGGLNAALKDTMFILGGVARAFGPVIVAAGALYAVYKILQSYSADAAFAIDDVTRALAAQAAPVASVDSAITDLTRVQETYTKAVMSAATASDNATKVIVANSEREFNAKKALLELELKRQEASLAVQRSEMALTGSQMKKDLGQQVFTNMDLERQGFADPRIGRFVNVLPDSITGMEKTLEMLAKNPANDKLKEMRANATLTEIALQKLRDALGQVFNAGGDAGPTFTGNAPIPTFRGIDDMPGSVELYDDLIKSGDARVRQLSQERDALGLTAGAAARLKFEQDAINAGIEKNVTFGPEQLAAIKRQADAYGQLTDRIAGMRLQQDAAFEREQLFRSDREANVASGLRGAGLEVNLASQDAAMLRSLEILKEQKKAWEGIRDVGRSAIDDIVDGMSNGFENGAEIFKGILKDINKELLSLAVANPLKNAIYGDSLPTMDSVGGIGGIFKALTGGKFPGADAASKAVGSMTVTAASVVVNGGTAAGLGSLVPANSNVAKVDPVGEVLRAALPNAGVTKTGIPLSEITAASGLTAKVNAQYADRFQGLLNDLKGAGYNVSSLGEGGYSYRNVKGTSNLSKHSFGEALDINPRQNPWSSKLQTDLPANVNDIAKRNGLTWGGTWNKPDTMHFQVDKSANTAALALDKMAGNAGAATQNLGTFGNGLGQFGDALSKFPTAPQGGGGGGGIGGWLSSLFGGAFKPNGAQATFAANGGIGLYANGGISDRPAIFGEAGPEAAVPLPDGRRIPVEMRMPRIVASNSGARPVVNRSIHFHGAPAGYTAEIEEEEDGQGNEKVNVIFSKIAANEAKRPGSPLNKTLKGMGVRAQSVRR